MPAPVQDYVALGVAEGVDTLALIVTQRAAELRAAGGPINDANALKMERAFVVLYETFEATAAAWAVEGTRLLREHERETRVRPDTLGAGGPRLSDFLFTEAITQAPGSIGIANEDTLDANVPWWPTNEFGSSTQKDEGRILFGAFFQPGPETRPNTDEAQEHALFEPRGRGEFRGSGVVTHPIIAKRFIESATTEIDAGWRLDLEAAIAKFIGEMP